MPQVEVAVEERAVTSTAVEVAARTLGAAGVPGEAATRMPECTWGTWRGTSRGRFGCFVCFSLVSSCVEVVGVFQCQSGWGG